MAAQQQQAETAVAPRRRLRPTGPAPQDRIGRRGPPLAPAPALERKRVRRHLKTGMRRTQPDNHRRAPYPHAPTPNATTPNSTDSNGRQNANTTHPTKPTTGTANNGRSSCGPNRNADALATA
ncbi:hypothetical protein Nans01_28220 [Nocardiopsis ansamitocini]|uniref:Uncharacterized protein n=1 Tax=Nocardiopsis ansamitocini TaxID=1670832 RepID=A0A9W6P7J1_9ACTN|nr:hypothetical protein Nans01_28220 [Nocardiopsis ansamitocini]